MKDFKEKLAVITGAGSGIGRELARQLASEGCRLAICDIMADNLTETREVCEKVSPPGNRVSHHICDVSEESQVMAFRDEVKTAHDTDHIHLLFNNAGIGGGGSFVLDDRAEWDKTFAVCWFGVYYCTRAFLPLLMAADKARIVNMSSVNGFFACFGVDTPHTAYSSAKFAVKGFSEGLIIDLRQNAPHVSVSVVMPGHIGTAIGFNSMKIMGKPDFEDMPASDVQRFRERIENRGIPTADVTDDQIKALLRMQMETFRDSAPLGPSAAAAVILDGIRRGRWRILVGEDAAALDRMIRESPEAAYEQAFMDRLVESGYFTAIGVAVPPSEEA